MRNFLKNYSASFLGNHRRSQNELCSGVIFQPFDGLDEEGLLRNFFGEIVSDLEHGCEADKAADGRDEGQFVHRHREQHLEGLSFRFQLYF